MTAVREATATRGAELLVARPCGDGMLSPAGAVTMGVTAEVIDAFQIAWPSRRGLVRLRVPVPVAIDCHGRPNGPVRDAVLRGLLPNGEPRTLSE